MSVENNKNHNILEIEKIPEFIVKHRNMFAWSKLGDRDYDLVNSPNQKCESHLCGKNCANKTTSIVDFQIRLGGSYSEEGRIVCSDSLFGVAKSVYHEIKTELKPGIDSFAINGGLIGEKDFKMILDRENNGTIIDPDIFMQIVYEVGRKNFDANKSTVVSDTFKQILDEVLGSKSKNE